jgi:hypothetical protein
MLQDMVTALQINFVDLQRRSRILGRCKAALLNFPELLISLS